MRLAVLFAISLFLLGVSFGIAGPDTDPFAPGEEERLQAPEKTAPTIFTLLEFIEVDRKEFAGWTLDHKLAIDATELREEVQEWIDSEEAELIESVVLQSLSGTRAKTEAIDEKIYPTEYLYEEIEDENAPEEEKRGEGLMAPQAFETRNVGLSLEIDAASDPEKDSVRMEIAPELVILKGFTGWPEDAPEIEQAFMPDFYTSTLKTSIEVKNGVFSLLGSTDLPAEDEGEEDRFVLIFIRADVDGGK